MSHEDAGDPQRHESVDERADRNWTDLVQELRVAQTGVQVLAGFLMTLPFTSAFGDLSPGRRVLYLATFGLSVLTVGLLTAPVSLHRFWFGRHAKPQVVRIGDVLARCGLASLGLTLVGAVGLVVAVVVGDLAGALAASGAVVGFVSLWVLVPLRMLPSRP